MSITQIQENTIATHLFILGPRDAKVLTVNRASNTALIQFRDLESTPNAQNTRTVLLDTLRAKAS